MVTQLLFTSAFLILFEYGCSEQNKTTQPTETHKSTFYMTLAILGDWDPAETPLSYSVWTGCELSRASDKREDSQTENEIPRVENDDRRDKELTKESLNITSYITFGLPRVLDPFQLPKYISLSDEPWWNNGTESVKEKEWDKEGAANSTNAEAEDLTYLILELPGILHDKEIPSSIHIYSPQLKDKEKEGGNLTGTTTSMGGNGDEAKEKKCQCLTQLSLGFPGRIDLKQLPLSMKVINPKRQ